MENMKTVDQLRTELKSYIYSDSGRAINSRFKREYLISNGYSEHLAHIDSVVAPLFPSMTYSEHLRIFCRDMVYQPVCKQCGKEHLIWKRNGWATYCSQRCSMDDPVYKAKMSEAMKATDWKANLEKRANTIKERYGVEQRRKIREEVNPPKKKCTVDSIFNESGEYSDELVEACKNTTAIGMSKGSKSTVVLKQQVLEATPFLDHLETQIMSARLFCITNRLYEIPKCEICGNDCSYSHLRSEVEGEPASYRFGRFCGKKCASKDAHIPRHVRLLLENREWLFNQINVKENTFKGIARDLGIADATVKKYADRHNIEIIKYRKGVDINPDITNPEWLTDQLITQKKTIDKVIAETGVNYSALRKQIDLNDIPYVPTSRQWSDAEIELREYIQSLTGEEVLANHHVNGGKEPELDIYIPSMKLGIEYNGCYWHGEKHKGKTYHKDKLNYFISYGIRIIQVWENDWNDNNQVVKAFLKNIIVPKKYIGARKTSVVELSQEEFNVFMDSLHMQGSVACPIRYGLMHEGVLAAAMGFKTIPRNTEGSDGGYDLVRFANTNVYGGFSKILKHFEKTHNPKLVKSFADLEIVDSVNNVYASNGFTAVETIPPDYRYFNRKTGNREHKFGWRKSKFASLGMDITDKTEFMLADEYGLIRLWDSGKIRYEKSCQ